MDWTEYSDGKCSVIVFNGARQTLLDRKTVDETSDYILSFIFAIEEMAEEVQVLFLSPHGPQFDIELKYMKRQSHLVVNRRVLQIYMGNYLNSIPVTLLKRMPSQEEMNALKDELRSIFLHSEIDTRASKITSVRELIEVFFVQFENL